MLLTVLGPMRAALAQSPLMLQSDGVSAPFSRRSFADSQPGGMLAERFRFASKWATRATDARRGPAGVRFQLTAGVIRYFSPVARLL